MSSEHTGKRPLDGVGGWLGGSKLAGPRSEGGAHLIFLRARAIPLRDLKQQVTLRPTCSYDSRVYMQASNKAKSERRPMFRYHQEKPIAPAPSESSPRPEPS